MPEPQSGGHGSPDKLGICKNRVLTQSNNKIYLHKTNNDCSSSINSLKLFTKDNIGDISKSRSIFFTERSYNTNETECSVIASEIIEEIVNKLDNEHFYLIYGNSGRGKSFFVFDLMESILKRKSQIYDKIMYYSPHLEIGILKEENLNLILDCLRKETRDKRLFLIIDDCHLVNDNFKKELLFQSDVNLSLLLITRDKKRESPPYKYKNDKFMKDFNKVAENTFKNIVEKFCKLNTKRIELTPHEIEHDLKNEIEGSNLVFLTLILQTWGKELSDTGENLSINEILNSTYNRFLELYDKHHSREWIYINNIVSALFQYEIRIARRYLSSNNPRFNNSNCKPFELDKYLNDCMVHDRTVKDKEGNNPYYVFMDFQTGEEYNMMKHASEFRFYLDARGNYLTFDNTSMETFDRIDFTLLVLKDYLLSFPENSSEVPEVLARIIDNANPDELDDIMSALYDDSEISSIIL